MTPVAAAIPHGNAVQPQMIFATLSAGALTLNIGYQIYENAVLFVVLQRIGDNQATLWRNFWASKPGAERALELLLEDCFRLIAPVRTFLRPSEDFSVSDLTTHLKMRLENVFH